MFALLAYMLRFVCLFNFYDLAMHKHFATSTGIVFDFVIVLIRSDWYKQNYVLLSPQPRRRFCCVF